MACAGAGPAGRHRAPAKFAQAAHDYELPPGPQQHAFATCQPGSVYNAAGIALGELAPAAVLRVGLRCGDSGGAAMCLLHLRMRVFSV
jgi:hypothetical protein